MENRFNYQPKYNQSWALIIGINNYKNISPLGYAKNDATAVAEILEKKFFFKKSNIELLTDENATLENIKKSFLFYANEKIVSRDDRLLVFYAGHGHTISSKRGEVGYLVPVDGNVTDISTLIRWDDFTRNADLVPAKHIFFLMDACYGGLAFLRSPSFGSMRFLNDMLKRYSRQVLTAGKADEVVSDGNGTRAGHSIFTSHLLDALEGSAATNEGIITANSIMAYVYERVAKDQYSQQTPHYGFVDGDGDFIFDTSVLEPKNKKLTGADDGRESQKGAGDVGDDNILINTSAHIATPSVPEMPITETTKEFLSEPTKKIKLDDFVSYHIRQFLNTIDLRNFPVQDIAVSEENFVERLNKYEELSKDLQQIVVLVAKWGNREQLLQLEKIFKRIAEADKGSAGTELWLNFTWYPIQYLMYSSGISALSSKNYDALKIIFELLVRIDTTSDRLNNLVTIVEQNLAPIGDSFKAISGHERHRVPRSEHLFTELQPLLEDMLFLGRSYEILFDDFEVLYSIEYAHLEGGDWGPPGRFSWKHRRGYGNSPYNRIIEEANKNKENWGPLKAGLFNGSLETFLKKADACKVTLEQLYW